MAEQLLTKKSGFIKSDNDKGRCLLTNTALLRDRNVIKKELRRYKNIKTPKWIYRVCEM
jgi:hypothetical protein